MAIYQNIQIISLLGLCFICTAQGELTTTCGPGCSLCNVEDPLRCYQCLPGNYMDSNFECSECQNGCMLCKNPNECLVCQQGFTPFQDACVYCQKNCLSCSVINNLTKTTSCTSCNIGYYTVNTTTSRDAQGNIFNVLRQACEPCLPQCLSCKNSYSCEECAYQFGFNTTSNQCYTCPDKCINCEIQSGCTSCINGYYPFTENQGEMQSCVACGQYCTECNIDGSCQQCQPGYYPSGENCAACVQPCELCSNETLCFSCSQGYFLETTIQNNTEQGGEYNYTLKTQCIACISNCDYCKDEYTCITCAPFFYFKDNSTCESCGNACVSCSDQGCIQCGGGFYLSQGQCKQCQKPCLFCLQEQNNNIFCSQCVSNEYAAVGGQCMLCSDITDGCVTCVSQDICFTCNIGYYLQGSQCLLDNGGLATVYIVLICIAGVIGLAAIVFGVYACWKSRNGYGVMGEGSNAGGVRASYYQFP